MPNEPLTVGMLAEYHGYAGDDLTNPDSIVSTDMLDYYDEASFDDNCVPENIKSGVEIFGVTGTNTNDADTSTVIYGTEDLEEGVSELADNTLYFQYTYDHGTDTSDATAYSSDILLGKTAYSRGSKITGICTYDSDTSDATATAEDIREGKTAYINGVKITGTAIIPEPLTVKSFSTATDKEITNMLTAVRAGDLTYEELVEAGWTVGAERSVIISAMNESYVGETHAAQNKAWVIVHGRNFFDLQDGSRNLFVIGLKDYLNEPGYMNADPTNSGGWNSCARRSWCNSVFRNAIPSEELKWFKQFKVKASNGNNSTSITESTDWFSLYSEAEVNGRNSNSTAASAEGSSILSYFSEVSHRLKTNNYWLRSPYITKSDPLPIFCCEGQYDDHASGQYANNNFYILPFGCF